MLQKSSVLGENIDINVQDGLDTFKQLQRQTSNQDDNSSERTKVEDEFNLHDFMNVCILKSM